MCYRNVLLFIRQICADVAQTFVTKAPKPQILTMLVELRCLNASRLQGFTWMGLFFVLTDSPWQNIRYDHNMHASCREDRTGNSGLREAASYNPLTCLFFVRLKKKISQNTQETREAWSWARSSEMSSNEKLRSLIN